MSSAVSVVIPTHERVGELRQLIESALAQTIPVEVLVMDDGERTATEEMVRQEFPTIHYHRLGTKRGPAFQRNRGVELASHNIVFPVDDDSLFVSPRTIEQTLSEFNHPRVGAVGIPFINVRLDTVVRQRAPDPGGIYAAHAYVGAAHAVRRDIFLRLGGYREHFFYMGEEGDYCLRMLNAGYITRLGNADPIHHLESPRRDSALADRCGRRNDVLFAWHNAPLAYLPAQLLSTTLGGLRLGLRLGHPLRMLRGSISGYAVLLRSPRWRQPVIRKVYALHREMKKGRPLRIEALEPLLPPLPGGGA